MSEVFAPMVWQHDTIAPDWYRDALTEARTRFENLPAYRHSRRREIVFAVCFAESYLFEWVRNDVLPALRREGLKIKGRGNAALGTEFKMRGDFRRLTDHYFPVNERPRPGVLKRWITVPARALAASERTDLPDFFKDPLSDTEFFPFQELPEWSAFRTLIDYRNGVVHGHTSRPLTNSQPEEEQPKPSASVLDELSPGWAVRVIFRVASRLHEAWGSPMPEWIVEP